MKKKTKTVIASIVGFILIVVASCDMFYNTDSPSFIQWYYLSSDKIDIKSSILYEEPIIHLAVYPSHPETSSRYVSFESEGEDAVIYQQLCEKYGDIDYNGTLLRMVDETEIVDNYSVDYMPKSITVISDSDFNEDYKAGDVLNDIIEISYLDIDNFIKSGYTKNSNGRDSISFLTIVLNDLKLDDMDLLFYTGSAGGGLPYFTFPTQPTLSRIHTFTLTLESDNEEPLIREITIDFDQE